MRNYIGAKEGSEQSLEIWFFLIVNATLLALAILSWYSKAIRKWQISDYLAQARMVRLYWFQFFLGNLKVMYWRII